MALALLLAQRVLLAWEASLVVGVPLAQVALLAQAGHLPWGAP